MWLYVPNLPISTRAPATAGSASRSRSSSVCAPSVPLQLSGTHVQRPLTWHGWKRRAWVRHLSGLTCSRSMVARGVAAWIASLPVSPVSHGPMPDNEKEPATRAGCGLHWPAQSAVWDRGSSTWRMSLPLFQQADLSMCSLTLPKWGSMRNGAVSPQATLKLRKSENAFGFSRWPTPTVGDSVSAKGYQSANGREKPSLRIASEIWQTPRSHEVGEYQVQKDGSKAATLTGQAHGSDLRTQVRSWDADSARPSPAARDYKGVNATGKHHTDQLPNFVEHLCGHLAPEILRDGDACLSTARNSPRRYLNPNFVGWLMGLPRGLMRCDFSATELCHWLRQQRSWLSQIDFRQ